MIFKEFLVDHNMVTIDGKSIDRPHYMSASQWFDFWEFSEEANLGTSIQDQIDSDVDAIISQNEHEHEQELQKQAIELKTSFNERIQDIIKALRHATDSIEDDLISIKFNEND